MDEYFVKCDILRLNFVGRDFSFRPQWESNPAGKNVRSPFIQSQRSNPLGYI